MKNEESRFHFDTYPVFSVALIKNYNSYFRDRLTKLIVVYDTQQDLFENLRQEFTSPTVQILFFRGLSDAVFSTETLRNRPIIRSSNKEEKGATVLLLDDQDHIYR